MNSQIKEQYLSVTDKCRYSLIRHVTKSMQDELFELAEESHGYERDVYGSGELINSLETEIAELLGKPAALFLPSGTLAQPIALRIWSEVKNSNWFAIHPTSHLELHEFKGYQSLHGLQSVLVGDPDHVPTLKNIKAITDPISSLVLELPMREIGGQLPEWQDLVEQSHWAREQGIALHMDGARLWQCPSYYNRSLADIGTLFDSIYVSLYKDLGGISGSILAGPEWFIESARTWSRRGGGNLFSFYPYVLAAKKGLRENLPKIPEAARAATWLAEFFNQQTDCHTVPEKPQTNMFHLYIKGNGDELIKKALLWSQKSGVAIFPVPRSQVLLHACFEINLGTNILAMDKNWWLKQLNEFIDFIK